MGIILTDRSHGHCLPPCSLSFIIKSNYLILLAFFTVRETFTILMTAVQAFLSRCQGFVLIVELWIPVVVTTQVVMLSKYSPLLFLPFFFILHLLSVSLCFNLCFIYMLVLFLRVLVPDLLFSASSHKCKFSFGHFLF